MVVMSSPPNEKNALWFMSFNTSENKSGYSTTYNELKVPESFGVGIFSSPIIPANSKETATIKIAPHDPYEEYLYVSNQMTTENDFLIFCLLDYQQIPFELDNSSALIHHSIHLEPFQDSFYKFKIPPLNEGFHDFEIFVIMKSGDHSLNESFRHSTDNSYLGSKRVNLIVGNMTNSSLPQFRTYDGAIQSCGSGYVLNDGLLLTKKPCDNVALLSDAVAPASIFDYSVNIAADNKYPVSVAIIPLVDYYQVPLANNSKNMVAFFNLSTGEKMSIRMNIRVPPDAGTHELMVLWIPQPYRSIDEDSRSIQKYHQWATSEPSIRVGLDVGNYE